MLKFKRTTGSHPVCCTSERRSVYATSCYSLRGPQGSSSASGTSERRSVYASSCYSLRGQHGSSSVLVWLKESQPMLHRTHVIQM